MQFYIFFSFYKVNKQPIIEDVSQEIFFKIRDFVLELQEISGFFMMFVQNIRFLSKGIKFQVEWPLWILNINYKLFICHARNKILLFYYIYTKD